MSSCFINNNKPLATFLVVELYVHVTHTVLFVLHTKPYVKYTDACNHFWFQEENRGAQ